MFCGALHWERLLKLPAVPAGGAAFFQKLQDRLLVQREVILLSQPGRKFQGVFRI
jgi:surfactin synthase thioesterase subunit